MPWRARLVKEAIPSAHEDFDLLYHASLRPAFPPDYALPGLVAVTFRFHKRPQGGHLFVTALDIAAALRLGARFGLDEAEALAMVDSHERMHIFLQLDGIQEHAEEEASRFVDAVWLSLRHPRAAHLVEDRPLSLVSRVGPDFWERLIDPGA